MKSMSLMKLIFNIFSIIMIFSTIYVSNSDAGIAQSKHDFSMGNARQGRPFAGNWQLGPDTQMGPVIEEICVFCHTPHAASKDPQTSTLLWNRIPSNNAYTPYTSSSGSVVGLDTGTKPTGVSMMCMSCHDGVTSIAVNVGNNINTPTLLNPPTVTGVPNQVSIAPDSIMPLPGAIGNIYKGNPTTGGWGANIGNVVMPGGSGSNIDMSNDHPISFEWVLSAGYKDPPTALRLFGSSGRRIECATCHLVHDDTIEPFLAMNNANSAMCLACHIK